MPGAQHETKQETAGLFAAPDLSGLAIESLPSGVLMLDANGTIVLVNHEIEQQFGYSRAELIGQTIDMLVPDAARQGHAALRREFQLKPEARQMAAGQNPFGRRRDGSLFPVEVRLNQVRTAAGALLLVSVIDISARWQAELAVQRESERMLELDRLLADLSFEFINLPSDQVLPAIRDALRRIGTALEVDRCSFWRMKPDGQPVVPLEWHRAGIPANPALDSAKTQFPWALETLRAGNLLSFSRVDEVPNPTDRASYQSLGIRSAVTVPMSVGGHMLGAVGFNMLRDERVWARETILGMRSIASVFSSILMRCDHDDALREAISKVEGHREQLEAENSYLRREVRERLGAGSIIGHSQAIGRVLEQVRQVAATDSTVLLLGETGTGKELLAAHVHELSARRGRTMVRVNCAAIPSTLIESELFGREKGAFTGALTRQIGRFELADHSTIFLDEIGDLPAEIQVKLLRVLEERQIERLGNPKGIHVDVRIVAATHRDLEQKIEEDAFRADLFYRLNVFPIHVPPLRERVEDIPALVWRFVDEFSRAFGKKIDEIPKETMEALKRHPWPGNIRELRNVVERAMILATSPRLTITLPAPSNQAAKRSLKLTGVETEHILRVLESTGWRIRGANGAAERLGLRPTTLESRMSRLGIEKPRRP